MLFECVDGFESSEEMDDVGVVYGHNSKSNDVKRMVIDMDEKNEKEKDEMKRVRYEHLLGNRVAEWMNEIVHALNTMSENVHDVHNALNTKANAEVWYRTNEQTSAFASSIQHNLNANILSLLSMKNYADKGIDVNGNDCAMDGYKDFYEPNNEVRYQTYEQNSAFETSFQPQPNANILSILNMANDANVPYVSMNVHDNEHANVFNDYSFVCSEGEVNLKQIHENGAFGNAIHGYIGFEDGDFNDGKINGFYNPIYKDFAKNDVGYDDYAICDDGAVQSDWKLEECLYESYARPVIPKPTVLSSLGLGTGLGIGFRMDMKELQKYATVYDEFAIMDKKEKAIKRRLKI